MITTILNAIPLTLFGAFIIITDYKANKKLKEGREYDI